MLSTATTACRALMALGVPAASASLLPAATPALYQAAKRLYMSLGASEKLFSSSTFAGRAAEAVPDTKTQEQDPAKEQEGPKVAMHLGMVCGDTADPSLSIRELTKPAGGKFTDSYMLMHPVYSKEYVESVRASHQPPVKMHEKLGYCGVQTLRRVFDAATGYGTEMNERKWLARFLYLETVAGVPGMVAGMLRHMRSLRTMQRDNGWIHTLLEEAENERMHLLTFMQLRQPGIMFRAAVLAGQAFFFNAYMLAYTVSPKSCHSFVGYLEEEATKTYTRAIQDLEDGKLEQWSRMTAPDIGKKYWRLAPDATMRDLLMAIRADEACHMYVNHTLSHIDKDAANPFQPGSVYVP